MIAFPGVKLRKMLTQVTAAHASPFRPNIIVLLLKVDIVTGACCGIV